MAHGQHTHSSLCAGTGAGTGAEEPELDGPSCWFHTFNDQAVLGKKEQ